MTRIHAVSGDERKIYQIQLHTTTNIDIDKIQKHPNILSPCKSEKQPGIIILSYNVLANGMTLREFITRKKVRSNSLRNTFHNTIHPIVVNPTNIILQIISACEFMLSNNMLSSQANITPNNIWIEHDENGNHLAYIINQFELTVENGGDYLDEQSKNYWAPEILRKHNNRRYYGADITSSISTLKRYNTTPSTLNIVYSLGLIVYFIVFGEDPFPELRIQEFEGPIFRRKSKYTECIQCALTPDVKERINLSDWKEYITRELNPRDNVFSKIYKYMYKTA